MDNLIVWENCQTLDELYGALTTADMGSDAYKNLNKLLEKFVDYVLGNKNLWFTLYNAHFQNTIETYEVFI